MGELRKIEEIKFRVLIKKLHKGLRVKFEGEWIYIDGSKKYHRLTMPQFLILKQVGMEVCGNIVGLRIETIPEWIDKLEGILEEKNQNPDN